MIDRSDIDLIQFTLLHLKERKSMSRQPKEIPCWILHNDMILILNVCKMLDMYW